MCTRGWSDTATRCSETYKTGSDIFNIICLLQTFYRLYQCHCVVSGGNYDILFAQNLISSFLVQTKYVIKQTLYTKRGNFLIFSFYLLYWCQNSVFAYFYLMRRVRIHQWVPVMARPWLWNMVSYIKGGIQAKGIWKQDPEANFWAQEGWECGVEKAPQWGTS